MMDCIVPFHVSTLSSPEKAFRVGHGGGEKERGCVCVLGREEGRRECCRELACSELSLFSKVGKNVISHFLSDYFFGRRERE